MVKIRIRLIASVILASVIAHDAFCEEIQQGKRLLLGSGKPWETPIYVNDSGHEGPTVMVLGGIHGNEPAGAASADQIRHWPIISGKLVVIPRVNRAALREKIRYVPEAASDERDLNRNFPSPSIADNPRGEIAKELWDFVVKQDPDWLFDLHEGYQFNISHQPSEGKAKSVGSTIIFDQEQKIDRMVERMFASVNGLVTDPKRKFLLLKRGPIKTSLAAAAIDVLGKKAMILETTHQYQRLPVRTRQHREMMSVALREIGMIDQDLSDVVTPEDSIRSEQIHVALFDDTGGSSRGVNTLSNLLSSRTDMVVCHIDAKDVSRHFLDQFDVIVFGGGSGSSQARTLGEDGKEVVRSFIQDGGGYIGICGGAYLCSAFYPWSLKVVDTHVFTGVREIKGVGRKAMYLRGPTTEVKMELTDHGQRIFGNVSQESLVKFHNGPIVSPMQLDGLPAYTVLAHFRSEQVLYPPQEGTMIDTPAIVMGEFGAGSVIAISPHPESTEGLEEMISQAVRAVKD